MEPRPLRSPRPPSLAERLKHAITHLPYRDWCPYCVAGKRPNSPHRRVKLRSSLPLLSADYGFFGDEKSPPFTVIVVYIRPFGIYVVAIVDQTGATDYMVKQLSDWIQQCGLVRFLDRSDREASLKLLVETAVKESGRDGKRLRLRNQRKEENDAAEELQDFPPVDVDQPDPEEAQLAGPEEVLPNAPTELAVPEHSHVGESQRNGATERSVQLLGRRAPPDI